MKFAKAASLFAALPNHQSILLSGPPGTGKCLGRGTPVLLSDGRVLPVEQIATGDKLMGPDGRPREVLSTAVGRGPLYRVEPIKGEPWVCNDVHILTLVSTDTDKVIDIGLDKWFSSSANLRTRHKMFSVGIDHFDHDLPEPPIDPYFIGAWYGDGTHDFSRVSISKPDKEIRDLCYATAAAWELRVRVDGEPSNPTYNLVGERGQGNRLLRTLRDFVGPNMNVPAAILRGSRQTRLSFLAGFLDTDGELGSNCFVISQKREDWARAAWFVARSLGLCATITARLACDQNGTEGTYRVVTISGDVGMVPTRITRKQAAPRQQIKVATRTGFAALPIGEGDYYGFTLDGDGRFLLGDFTVTHNTALAKLVGSQMAREGQPAPVIEVRDLCSHLPEDLLGLPFREGQTTIYAPPAWLHRLSQPGTTGVLVLDDLGAAAPAVQTAAFKLVLDRRSGDCILAPGVKILATTNRKEDKSGATTLPAALRNRCLIQELEVDADEWCIWAAQNKLPGDVPAFIRFKPGHLSHLPKDADKSGAFATPRTWEMTGRSLQAAKENDAVYEVASGLLGEGVAVEFTAFVRLRGEIPDPRAVLMDPKGMLPNPPSQPDRVIAIITTLAEIAAPLSQERSALGRDIPTKFLLAMAHCTKMGREYASAGVLTYAANDGHVNALIKAATALKNDPEAAPFLQHLKAALNPNG